MFNTSSFAVEPGGRHRQIGQHSSPRTGTVVAFAVTPADRARWLRLPPRSGVQMPAYASTPQLTMRFARSSRREERLLTEKFSPLNLSILVRASLAVGRACRAGN